MSNANEMGTEVHVITESDRAVARRVIRRFAGSPEGSPVYVDLDGRFPGDSWFGLGGFGVTTVGREIFSAAAEAAAAGRAYAAALRGAK